MVSLCTARGYHGPMKNHRTSRATGGMRRPRVPRKWAWHHRALLGLRRRLLHQELDQLKTSLQAAEVEPGEPDAGAEPEREFAFALLAHEQDALREINDALDRIEAGTYGKCAVTGLPIPASRLRAVPWTRHLREIASQRENANRDRR